MSTLTDATPDAAPAKPVRWTAQWKELYEEVISTGLCTGCAGCVISCPHDVIGYNHEERGYKPFHLEDELGPTDCSHGQKGCTSCTRACPRFRAWEPEANEHLFDREREPDEMSGITKDMLLCRASDDMVHQMGQDGGLVSALLIWAMEEGYIDAALSVFLEGDGSTLEGRARRGPQQGGDPRLGRIPLHVLGQHPRHEARPSTGLHQARPRGHELPVVGAAGDVAPQDRQDRQAASCSTSGCCAPRRSTTPSSTSSSRPSTA